MLISFLELFEIIGIDMKLQYSRQTVSLASVTVQKEVKSVC